jgi:hypothetical protein
MFLNTLEYLTSPDAITYIYTWLASYYILCLIVLRGYLNKKYVMEPAFSNIIGDTYGMVVEILFDFQFFITSAITTTYLRKY